MSWVTFGQVVLLIVVFAFVTTFVKCIHDIYCTKCKKQRLIQREMASQ